MRGWLIGVVLLTGCGSEPVPLGDVTPMRIGAPVGIAPAADLDWPDMAVSPPDMAPYAPGTIGAPCDASSECLPVAGAYEVRCQGDPDRRGEYSCCYQPTENSGTYCHMLPP